MTISYQKIGIFSLATMAMWSTTSSIALAEINWNGVIASYTNANGDVIDRVTESNLCADSFITCNNDGSITFRADTAFSSDTGSSSSYRRSELRVFADDAVTNDDGSLSGTNLANNFVLDSASSDDRDDAGGVNGAVAGSLSIDRLPTTGLDETSDSDFEYGECSDDFDADYDAAVIFSQFHASDDEPMRAYAVATGSNTFGIWIIHEPSGGDDIKCPMSLSRDLQLNERFVFVAHLTGDQLYARVTDLDGRHLGEVTVNISGSDYDEDGEYFFGKWGAYNSNNQGNTGDYAAVTYYDQRYWYSGINSR